MRYTVTKNSGVKVFVLLILSITILIAGLYFINNNPFTHPPARDFKGEFAMGLIPNAPSREPFANDVVIGKVTMGEEVYGLFQSTHLETKDLGKIFVWRVK